MDQSRQLPPHQQLPQFLQGHDRSSGSNRASLHNFTIKPGAESRGDLFSELPISLSFDGDYLDVFSFLRGAEEMKRLTRIGTMSIKEKEGDSRGRCRSSCR